MASAGCGGTGAGGTGVGLGVVGEEHPSVLENTIARTAVKRRTEYRELIASRRL